MNERIRELVVEARNYALDEKRIYERVHNTEQCMEEYRDVYNKKFAELIVRKCLSIVEPDVGMACGDEWYTALEGAAQDIKEYFGVEE